MQELGLVTDSGRWWWWGELVRVAKIMWGIVMKEVLAHSKTQRAQLSYGKDTLYKIDPPIWKWEEAEGRFFFQLTLWTLGHDTSRAPRAWHVPKGCGARKTTHMPNLGDSRRVRASTKENTGQRIAGKPELHTRLVQVQTGRSMTHLTVTVTSTEAGADIETNKGVIFISHFLWPWFRMNNFSFEIWPSSHW